MGKRLDYEEQATEVIRLAGLALRHFEVWRVYTDEASRNKLFPAIFSTKDPRPLHCTVQWMLDHPELRLRMDR